MKIEKQKTKNETNIHLNTFLRKYYFRNETFFCFWCLRFSLFLSRLFRHAIFFLQNRTQMLFVRKLSIRFGATVIPLNWKTHEYICAHPHIDKCVYFCNRIMRRLCRHRLRIFSLLRLQNQKYAIVLVRFDRF